MEIGMADTGRPDANEDLASPGLRLRDIPQLRRVWSD
jgi:hypothetical protein